MRLNGDRTFKSPRQAVWNLLLDPDELACCMPGCKSMEKIGPDEYRATVEVKIASMGGAFSGSVALLDKQEPDSYTMKVEGAGKLGHAAGSGKLRLVDKDGGTLVSYEGEVQVAGPIASVGQRLLGVSAKMMIGRFFNNVEERLKETAPSTRD